MSEGGGRARRVRVTKQTTRSLPSPFPARRRLQRRGTPKQRQKHRQQCRMNHGNIPWRLSLRKRGSIEDLDFRGERRQARRIQLKSQ